MTTNKDFKRLVRGRMRKTGESYTAARSHLIKQVVPALRVPSVGVATSQNGNGAHVAVAVSAPPRAAKVVAPAGPAPAEYARIAGMSDDAVKAKTGCTWERWVVALDHVKAYNWPHSEIARYVREKYNTPGWWTQMVTVGYERIRGLRERGQRRGGAYEASKSRTIPVSVGKLFRAFSQPKLRRHWLPGVELVVRKATPNKSIRITWSDGTSVTGWFIAKERSKSVVQLAHENLPSQQAAAEMKAFWKERLDALAELLTQEGK